MNELNLPAQAFDVPATRRGLNGRTWPGHGLLFGPSVDVQERRRMLRGEARVPGNEGASRSSRREHWVGVAISPRSEANRCRSNSSNGTWGMSSTLIVICPVFGSGMDLGDQLCVDPEAVEDHEHAVLIARQRLPDVERTVERVFEGRRVDFDRADLGVVRALPGRFSAEIRLGFGAIGLSVGGVGVDGEPFRQGQGRRAQRRLRGSFAGEELIGLELEVESRRGVGLGRCESRLQSGSNFWLSQPFVAG